MLQAFLLSLILTVLFMPFFIHFMRQRQFGQVTREEGPSWHQAKSGTPAMGGLVFIAAIIVAVLLTMLSKGQFDSKVIVIILGLLFFGGIGFADDFLKIFKKQNEGLTSKQKFLSQVIGSAIIMGIILIDNVPLSLPLPFFDSITNGLVIFIFLLIWITGFSNAFNLTDGLDGLSSGTGIVSFVTLALFALRNQQESIAMTCFAIVGGLLGFLIFNKKPAKIFMGDAGSLAMGAVLAIISMLLQNPWILLLVALINIIETLSVMLQVTSFKLTGKRIFLMSPIHHHFEMKGWSEWKIDIVFWLTQMVASIIAWFIF